MWQVKNLVFVSGTTAMSLILFGTNNIGCIHSGTNAIGKIR